MNRPDGSNFDEEVTLVSVPSEADGGDPLALFESESGALEFEVDARESRAEVGVSGPAASPSVASPLSVPTRTRPPLALDHLLRRLSHVEWPEAVAIVEGLCGVLIARESERVPEISRVAITAEGTVLAGTADSKDAVGPLLARMIHSLASAGSVPAPVRLFVTKWIGASENHSIAEFAKELAYFARPDGQALIRGVYERAVAAAPVQAKPVATPSQERGKNIPRRQPQSRPKAPGSRTLFGAAAAVVTLGIVVTGVLAWRGAPGPSRPPASGLPGAASAVTGEPTSLEPGDSGGSARAGLRRGAPRGAASGSSMTGEPAVRTPQGIGSLSADSRSTGTARTSIPASSAVRASIASPSASSPRIIPSSPADGDPSRAVRLSAGRTTRRDDSFGPPVYSRTDTDVIPPAFLYPQLPAQILPGLRPDMNTIELIVSETGVVERVRLLSTPKRMPDMMLLSGAKNWEFEPATKDGQSVRYRLELSWAATP